MAKNQGIGEAAKDTILVIGGALIGAAVSLLYAPQSGDKTRKQLAKKVDEAKDAAREAKDEVLDKVDDLRDTLADQIEEGAEFVGEQREAIVDGIESLQTKINRVKKRFR